MTLINAPGLPDFRVYFADIYAFRFLLMVRCDLLEYFLLYHYHHHHHCYFHCHRHRYRHRRRRHLHRHYRCRSLLTYYYRHRYRRCHWHPNKNHHCHLFQFSLIIWRSSSKPKEYLTQLSSRHQLSRSVYVDGGLDYMMLIISGWVRPIAWELLIVHRSHFLLYLDCINEITCAYIRSVIRDFGTHFV